MQPLSRDEVEQLYRAAESHLIKRWEPRPGYRPPIVVGGEGAIFWDASGRRYIDLISQLYNVHVGMGVREIIEAAKRQLDELAYASPAYYTVPQIRLAERLAELAPGDLSKVFFSNSGTEANEAAVKMAQLYRKVLKIISFWDSYHGSTYASISVGGSSRTRRHRGLTLFEEFKHVPSPYCYRCVFGLTYPECDLRCAEFIAYTIEKECEETVAAFMAEPICSWAGQVVPPEGYWRRVREICDEQGVLLIFDEVMTGFARTGRMFACEHWGIVPDITTYAKGITCGYIPLGATMVRKPIAEYFDKEGFPHSYTYSGHAVACATALATIEYYLKHKLPERAAELGAYMMDELRGLQERHPIIGDVRGLGLFMGIELVANPETKEPIVPKGLTKEQRIDPRYNPIVYLHDKALERGLAVGVFYHTGIVRMMPPLTITKEQIDEGLNLLEQTLEDVESRFNLPKRG